VGSYTWHPAMVTSPDPQKDIGSGSFVAKKSTDFNKKLFSTHILT
jgi:hypothetical protein